jgi:hypothetical protein
MPASAHFRFPDLSDRRRQFCSIRFNHTGRARAPQLMEDLVHRPLTARLHSSRGLCSENKNQVVLRALSAGHNYCSNIFDMGLDDSAQLLITVTLDTLAFFHKFGLSSIRLVENCYT